CECTAGVSKTEECRRLGTQFPERSGSIVPTSKELFPSCPICCRTVSPDAPASGWPPPSLPLLARPTHWLSKPPAHLHPPPAPAAAPCPPRMPPRHRHRPLPPPATCRRAHLVIASSGCWT